MCDSSRRATSGCGGSARSHARITVLHIPNREKEKVRHMGTKKECEGKRRGEWGKYLRPGGSEGQGLEIYSASCGVLERSRRDLPLDRWAFFEITSLEGLDCISNDFQAQRKVFSLSLSLSPFLGLSRRYRCNDTIYGAPLEILGHRYYPSPKN